MRKTRWLLLVLALPLAAGAVTLRYRLEAGQNLKYRETAKATGALKLTTALGEQTIALKMNTEEERSLKTVERGAGESWWLESRSLSAKGSMEMDGQTSSVDVPGYNFRIRMTPSGDVLEMKELATTHRGPEGLDLRLDALLAAARLTSFPTGDLQPGATWDKEIPVRSSDGQKRSAKVSNKLVRVRQVDGRSMAEIESRYEVPIPPTDGTVNMMGMALPVRVEGSSTGTTTALWDIQAGRSQSSTGKGKLHLKLLFVGLTDQPAIGDFDLDLGIALQP